VVGIVRGDYISQVIEAARGWGTGIIVSHARRGCWYSSMEGERCAQALYTRCLTACGKHTDI
jgi:hypothetical protein